MTTFLPWQRAVAFLSFSSMLGMLVGWAHAANVLYTRYLVGHLTWQTRDVPWMSPLANGIVLLAIGIAVLPLVLWRPRGWLRLLPIAIVITAALFPVLALYAPRVHPWALLLLSAGAGFRLATAGDNAYLRRSSVVRRSLAAMLVACGVVYGVLRDAPEKVVTTNAGTERPPNVLILLLDTVRAASMSVYGYARETTPRLHQLASEGVAFERAVSPSSWTLPSHASLFTGLAPHALQADWRSPLGTQDATVAERFSAHGYRTGGFVANNWYTSGESGLRRGFETWRDFERTGKQLLSTALMLRLPLVDELRWTAGVRGRAALLLRSELLRLAAVAPYPRKRADRVTAEFLEWQGQQPAAPFFAFLNLYDAHDPYKPPAPFDTLFSRQPTSQDHYDGGIAYLDAQIGALTDSLVARGLLENTIVVVTSDHGELFGENGLEGHGNGVFWRSVHIPMVIRAPGLVPAEKRIAQPVSQIDLAMTLLTLAGIDAGRVGGRSLSEYWDGVASREPLPVLTEFWSTRTLDEDAMPRELQLAVFSDSLQFIRHANGTESLFNLHLDSTGSTAVPLAAVNVEFVSSLRSAMEKAIIARSPQKSRTLDTGSRNELLPRRGRRLAGGGS